MQPLTRPRLTLLGALLVGAGCASAGDRLNEGIQLQSEGRYMEAAYRYADAVDKDSELVEAQDRLLAVGDTAIELALARATNQRATGDPIRAAETFQSVDALLSRVREVGFSLSPPVDYADLRREAFDWAIEALMSDGEELVAEGRFRDARRALRRARSDFTATNAQRTASFAAEIDLLLTWADAELSVDRYRAAFGLAGEAVELRPSPTRRVLDEADQIRVRALELGTVALAILPITSVASVREQVAGDLEAQLSDDLELDYWRDPPPFVATADPVLVRRLVRDATRGGAPLSSRALTRVLGAVAADFGALVEVTSLDIEERDVEREPREVRSRRGGTASYFVEEGRLRYEAEVEVIVIDYNGNEVRDFRVSARGTGRFERGVFRGNPQELDLSRNEARLFDPDVLAAQHARVQREVVGELAADVARRTFEAVLSRVR